MEQGYIITYNSRFTNNNPHTVIDKETSTNRRTWMDFNARYLLPFQGADHPVDHVYQCPYVNAIPPFWSRVYSGISPLKRK